MVQSGIRVGPASSHSWWHWCQIQQRSLSMFPPGPEGVAEWGQPTYYLEGSGECPEEPHRGTIQISRANSNWTTTTSINAASAATASVSTTSVSTISVSAISGSINSCTITSHIIRFVWLLTLWLVLPSSPDSSYYTHIAIGAISHHKFVVYAISHVEFHIWPLILCNFVPTKIPEFVDSIWIRR